MPPEELPDFDQALGMAAGQLDAAELSECHGVACGLLCRRGDSSGDDYLSLLAMLQLLAAPDTALREIMLELYRAAGSQLADQQLRLSLWLPGDEEMLEERTAALGQWCTGFLAGLGSGEGGLGGLSEEAMEALEDLRQIACAEVSGETGEEEEEAFFQVMEYVRVVTMLLREELRGPAPDERIH
jgi:uncharacterized protein YgfB (UPF0149 family)